MAEKTVKVLNTRDRYYNGAYKGQILTISESEKENYLKVGFVLVGDSKVEVKENIVEDDRPRKELQELLDHYGVEYNKKAKRGELLALVKDLEKKQTSETEKNDIEALKKQLVDNVIFTQEEVDEMKEEDILENAKINGLL